MEGSGTTLESTSLGGTGHAEADAVPGCEMDMIGGEECACVLSRAWVFLCAGSACAAEVALYVAAALPSIRCRGDGREQTTVNGLFLSAREESSLSVQRLRSL